MKKNPLNNTNVLQFRNARKVSKPLDNAYINQQNEILYSNLFTNEISDKFKFLNCFEHYLKQPSLLNSQGNIFLMFVCLLVFIFSYHLL